LHEELKPRCLAFDDMRSAELWRRIVPGGHHSQRRGHSARISAS
jgi:hypothetical protein